MGDITERAADVLRRVEVVAAEDTRRSRILLQHIGASPKLLAVHAHSEASQAAPVIAHLSAGRAVALVTDAGTPGISDPGARLVAAVREAGHPVVPVPGPSAVAAALSASGLPADRYLFLGFLDRKGADRHADLVRALREPWPVVLYEAPNRLVALLEALVELGGKERTAMVARELTKVHEELRFGTLADLAAWYGEHEPKGEVTVVLAGAPQEGQAVDLEELRSEAARLLAGGMSRKDVVRSLTAASALSRNEVYRLVMDLP